MLIVVSQIRRTSWNTVHWAAPALKFPRYAAYQGYYSLIGRDYESELMPLGLAEGVGCVVWSLYKITYTKVDTMESLSLLAFDFTVLLAVPAETRAGERRRPRADVR